jgi:octopine/nopaline transport system ATP-binding protein
VNPQGTPQDDRPQDPAVSVRDLNKSFGALHVLKGVSLDAREGDVVSILGASGSGKSTMLRCINMLEVPDSGEVRIGGELIALKPAGARAWSPRTAPRWTGSAPGSAWCSRASTSGPT